MGVDLQIIQSKIYEIRGQRVVMLDFNLATSLSGRNKEIERTGKAQY